MLKLSIVGVPELLPSEGETAIYISRYGQNWETVKYLATTIGDGYASFYLDNLFFAQLGGVYTARFVYLGYAVGAIDFEYHKDKISIVGSVPRC